MLTNCWPTRARCWLMVNRWSTCWSTWSMRTRFWLTISHWSPVGQPLVNCWSTTCQLLVNHLSTVGQPLVNCWSTIGQPLVNQDTLLAHGQPLVNHLSTVGQLLASCSSTIGHPEHRWLSWPAGHTAGSRSPWSSSTELPFQTSLLEIPLWKVVVLEIKSQLGLFPILTSLRVPPGTVWGWASFNVTPPWD